MAVHGPGSEIRKQLGWIQMEKTDRFVVWFFRGAFRGKDLFSSLAVSGDWVKKGSYHTAWSVPGDSSCSCSYAYGHGTAIGPHTGKRCWPLLAGVWRAIAPLMKPWCAEGEVPTAAKLNLYRGWKSCVGWHCDDEPLFGKWSDAKLIVSVRFGSSAVVRWRRQSCPDDEASTCEGEVPTAANLNLYRGGTSRVNWHSDSEPLFGGSGVHKLIVSVCFGAPVLFKWKGRSCLDSGVRSCWLGHGDILVMDGQCQDEFLHCTSPGLEHERIKCYVPLD